MLKRHLRESTFQTTLIAILSCSIGHGQVKANDDDSHARPTSAVESCPVRLRSNVTGGAECVCTASALDEVVCSGGVGDVPEFLPNDLLFHAIYLSRQNIKEVIQGSFNNLQVGVSLRSFIYLFIS